MPPSLLKETQSSASVVALRFQASKRSVIKFKKQIFVIFIQSLSFATSTCSNCITMLQQPCLRAREISREVSSLHLFGKMFFPASLPYYEIYSSYLITFILLKITSVRKTHDIFIKKLSRLTFSRKTSANVLKLDGPNKEFNPENLKTLAINLKQHALKYEFHVENHGEFSASMPTRKQ